MRKTMDEKLQIISAENVYDKLVSAYHEVVNYDEDRNNFRVKNDRERELLGLKDRACANYKHRTRIVKAQNRYFNRGFIARNIEAFGIAGVILGYDSSEDHISIRNLEFMIEHPEQMQYVLNDFKRALAAGDSWQYRVLVESLRNCIGNFETYNRLVRMFNYIPANMRIVAPRNFTCILNNENFSVVRDAFAEIKDAKFTKKCTVLWNAKILSLALLDSRYIESRIFVYEKAFGLGDESVKQLMRSCNEIIAYHHVPGPIPNTGAKQCRLGSEAAAMLVQYVIDGIRIGNTSNPEVFEFKQIKPTMSFREMVLASDFNHRNYNLYQQKLNAAIQDDDGIMPGIPGLPEDLEDIRIKTNGEMRKAGEECSHCIGAYAGTDQLFFRKNNVCAKVDNHSLRIIQCYDVHNSVSAESREFYSWLECRLDAFKETKTIGDMI